MWGGTQEDEGSFKALPEEERSRPATWPGYSYQSSQDLEAATMRPFVLTYTGLQLGAMPALSLTRRLVTLTSCAMRPFEFEWDLSAAATLEVRKGCRLHAVQWQLAVNTW